jgi:hypothetical protein
MKTLAVSFLAILMQGCTTSAVVQVGPQSYSLSATRCGVCEAVSGYVTVQASNYCMAQHRFLIVRNMSGNNMQPWAPGSATINFSCVESDDPEYVRPTMRKDNGVTTIESH